MSSEIGIDMLLENNSVSISLSNDIFKDIPFHKYENNFTFIVDGKRYETNRIVADILSPIIRDSHYQDESLNEFIINTKANISPKSETGIDYFKDFLNLVYLKEVEIDPIHQEYYLQYIMQLGNRNFFKIDENIYEKLNNNNCVNYLRALCFFEKSQNTDVDDVYNQVIKFVANNFDKISKDELKTLSTGTIDDILRNENLQLNEEDTLLKFLLDLYKENYENAPLFEHVLFSNVGDELFNEFLDTFSIEDIDNVIWRSIICSLKFKKERKKSEIRCLMLGLDDSGKTQILYKMKLNEVVTTIPTIGFNVETVKHKGVDLNIWDVGGVDKIRPLWRHYYNGTDVIIFVIDSTNIDRLNEAKTELYKLLNVDELEGVPILILANKCDKQGSLTAQDLFERLELGKITFRKWIIQKSSALTGEGLNDGLDFIVKQAEINPRKNSK